MRLRFAGCVLDDAKKVEILDSDVFAVVGIIIVAVVVFVVVAVQGVQSVGVGR